MGNVAAPAEANMAISNDPNSQQQHSRQGIWARGSRLERATWIVTAACLGLVLFACLGRINIAEALVAGFILIAIAAVLPRAKSMNGSQRDRSDPNAAIADAIVESVADAMLTPTVLLDRKSNVVHRNPSAIQAFPQVNVGTPLTYALRQPALLEALTRARRDGAPQIIEVQQTSPGPVWYAVSITPFSPPGLPANDAQRYLVSFTNLTEQRRTETMRVDFVANASHELRTPLASVVGFIDTLLGPAADDPEARKRFLGIMRTQADRMSSLIEDLMSLSRIELRQHVRPTGSTDLGSLLKTVGEGLQNQISDAGVELELNLESGDTKVTGDHDELYEVFENLMDNAIKYGAGGGKVLLQLKSVEDRPGFAFAVTVQDFGEGIETEHVPRLTERFYRVDAESSRKKKGTGLGLAIVKHIVSRHRGQLIIRSAPGEGMRVDVLLPR